MRLKETAAVCVQKSNIQCSRRKLLINSYSLNDKQHQILTAIYNDAKDVVTALNKSEYLSIAKYYFNKINTIMPEFASMFTTFGRQEKYDTIFLEHLPALSYDETGIKVGELMSLTYAMFIGEPFQYLQQNSGKLVSHITPLPGLEMTQSGFGKQEFGWHTDDRFFVPEFRTKWIQLLGINNPEQTRTFFAFIDDIIERLDPGTIKILTEPRFEFRMPTSFGFNSQIWTAPASVLWLNNTEMYEVGIPTYNVKVSDATDIEAQKALVIFNATVEAVKRDFIIDNGCLIVFNNDRLLHSREAFSGERFLLRTYVRPDLADLRLKTGATQNVFDARLLL